MLAVIYPVSNAICYDEERDNAKSESIYEQDMSTRVGHIMEWWRREPDVIHVDVWISLLVL